MPELPEVETVRRDLGLAILKKKIIQVKIRHPKSVRSSSSAFHHYLVGNSFRVINRIGKLLIFHFSRGDHMLLCHLKMTGQLIYDNHGKLSGGGHSLTEDNQDLIKLPNQWTRVSLTFTDGSQLYFNDLRLFGFMQIVSPQKLEKIKEKFGIEPLTPAFTFIAFCQTLGKRKTSIKAVLLNQTLFAGIGNIYADESCFRARILSSRTVASLLMKEKKALYQAIQHILRQAIAKRGTTFNNFVDGYGKRGNFLSYLRVYGRVGKGCKRCRKGYIQKKKIAGRGTHFCPVCQM